METDDFGYVHGWVKVAFDRVLHHCAKLFERLALGVDPIPQRAGRIAAVHLILMDLKDNLAHRTSPSGSNLSLGKLPNKDGSTIVRGSRCLNALGDETRASLLRYA